MRAVVLRSLAVVGIGAILLSGLLYLASTVDGRPPSVIGIALTQPLPDEATRGLPTTSVEVTFGEPVEQATAAEAFSVQPAVEGSVSWTGSVMIFTPDEPLALESDYTVSIAPSVEDLAGNRMTNSPPAFIFETTGSPELVEAMPVDGAIEVALDAPISLRFSTLMDTASVEAALQLRPAFAHEARWSGQLLEIVPIDPLRADTDYRVHIGRNASDVSGVGLRNPVELEFRTVEPGIDPSLVVPSDATDGIAPTSPIVAFFDQPIDPESVSDELVTVTPEVTGSIQLVDELGNAPAEPEDGRVLLFTPSGPLPPNTTFEVRLAPDLEGLDGGGLTEPISWSFTTGAPPSTLSNQITFLSDRAGIANLWAMNTDGTAPHQLSTELTPILDYAVSPDGSSFVVGDGRRLVMAAADGNDARVLTEDGAIEFDPSYGPNGQRLAFARADAETGRGLGIWERQMPDGTVTRIELPPDAEVTPSVTASSETGQPDDRLRAPRYSPDGEAIAFVDSTGSVAVHDLATEAVTRIQFEAQAAPVWLPDGSAILLTGRPSDRTRAARELDVPVEPLEPGSGSTVVVVERASTIAEESAFGDGASVAAVAADGRIAYLRGDGSLRLTDDATRAGSTPPSVSGERVAAVAFAPGEDAMVIVLIDADGGEGSEQGSLERVDLGGEGREVLANDGRRPRWLP